MPGERCEQVESEVPLKANALGCTTRTAELLERYANGERDFSGADFSGADFTDADLTDANFTDADLTDAKLTDAKLAGAKLTDAKLAGARLSGDAAVYALLAGADLTRRSV